jgi:hypothetical protein
VTAKEGKYKMTKKIVDWFRKQNKTKSALQSYGDYYQEYRTELRKLLWYYAVKKHYRIATWGAGFKGIAFLATVDPKNESVNYVIDINHALHGTSLSTGHPVISSTEIKSRGIRVILVMNTNFYAEVYLELQKIGYQGILIDVDNALVNEFSVKQIIRANAK